jgi:Ca-activated chloride channel family protein
MVPAFRFSQALVAVATVVMLGAVAVPAAQDRPQTFRSGVNLVQLPVVVTARDGGLVRGLTRDEFTVTENGVVQTLQFFSEGAPGAKLPLHVGLLLDVSGSMGPDLAQAATAAVRFVNALDEAQDVTLVDFDESVRVARFGPESYPRLFERIREKKAAGATALFDAVGMYLRGAYDLEGQKVLLLYTDGGDTTSALNFGQLTKLLKLSDVLVYSIGYLSRESRMAQPQMQLTQIARDTGGEAFFPQDPRELNEIYAKILDELGSRYTLGYISTNPKEDGAWRKVEVKVTRPDALKARVRTRPGYYAPGAIR